MTQFITSLLVMLNPIALFLYLLPVMKELEHGTFVKVFLRATIISTVILACFMASGDFLFKTLFQINIESFRLFGGIIIFTFAFLFIVSGQKAFITIKGGIDTLPSEIALPFMVGAGNISLSIFAAQRIGVVPGITGLVIAMSVNFSIVMTLKFVRDSIKNYDMRVAFDRVMDIVLRLNGFFVGAIGVEMIRTALERLFMT
ncbi:MAG: MarC family protein [Patescibacteria group bacterium]